MNELARDLFSIRYESPKPLEEVVERIGTLIEANPAIRNYVLALLAQDEDVCLPPQKAAIRALVRRSSDDPAARMLIRWYAFQPLGEDGMSTEAVLEVLEEESPHFPHLREFIAQNAGAGYICNFESHFEISRDLGDHLASYVAKNVRSYPELLPTALGIMVAGLRRRSDRRMILNVEGLEDEFELAEFKEIQLPTPYTDASLADAVDPAILGEDLSCERVLELFKSTESHKKYSLISQIVRHFTGCNWLPEFLKKLVRHEEKVLANSALGLLNKIGVHDEVREVAISVIEHRREDVILVSSALRILKYNRSESACSSLLNLANEYLRHRYISGIALTTLAEGYHDRLAVKRLIYHRARRNEEAPQSEAAMTALFWYYGDEPEAWPIFEDTAKNAVDFGLRKLAHVILDCLRRGGVLPMASTPLDARILISSGNPSWVDALVLPGAREKALQILLDALLDESASTSDVEMYELPLRLALMFHDRSEAFECLLLVATLRREGPVRIEALRMLFCGWPEHPQVHAVLKNTAAGNGNTEQVLAIRLLCLAYPNDSETRTILKQIASRPLSDASSSAAFGEYLRLEGYSSESLEWALNLLRDPNVEGVLCDEGPWHLFRCFGPRKTLLAALLALAGETRKLDLLKSIIYTLHGWEPVALANTVAHRIENSSDEKEHLVLVEGLFGRSEEQIRTVVRICKTSPFPSVRFQALTALCEPKVLVEDLVPLGLPLIEDAPLLGAKIGKHLARVAKNEPIVAARLVECYAKVDLVEAEDWEKAEAMSQLTAVIASCYAETFAALEFFKARASLTADKRDFSSIIHGLSAHYRKDAVARSAVDQALRSGCLEYPDGVVSQVAASHSDSFSYLESLACEELSTSVQIAAIRLLKDYGEPGIQLLMKIVDGSPLELKNAGLGTLRAYVQDNGRSNTVVREFLSERGALPW